MIEFRKFPSIEQFRNIIKQVHANAKYHEKPIPTLEFKGTVKLHGCVSGETLITLANGESIPIKDIKKDTSIISYNVDSQKYEFDIVDDVLIQDLDKKWVRLCFTDGRYLECTECHPSYSTKENPQRKSLVACLNSVGG